MEPVLARRFLAACLLVLLAAPVGLAGWWDDLDRGESVQLSDLIAQSSRYRSRVVSFFCVFHGRDEVFAPLAAPFSAQKHVNFAVWKDGAPVWEQEAYKRDYPFLYMGRTHPQMGELLSLEPFTRIEVTGRLKGLIRARPCIDVISFRETGHRLGRPVVQSIMAGDRHSEQGQRDLAYDNYLRALRPDLPPSYKLLVEKRVAEGLRRLGRHAEAASIEGGGILGAGNPPGVVEHPPGSLLGDPLPGDPGVPAPVAVPPLVTTDDLPGRPVGAEAVTAPRDLPGEPVGPRPVTRDLPGVPAGDAEGAPVPVPPAVAEDEVEPPPESEEAREPRPPRLPPTRHQPRLSGVK